MAIVSAIVALMLSWSEAICLLSSNSFLLFGFLRLAHPALLFCSTLVTKGSSLVKLPTIDDRLSASETLHVKVRCRLNERIKLENI